MLHQLLNPTALLSSYGAIGLFVVLFAETGLLIGFFLPGDSLLFAAGLACATAPGAALHMSLPAVMAAAAGGALIGAQTGYLIGRSAGPALLRRSRSRKLHQGAERATAMLTRYGPGKAVLLARFIPVVRTVANPTAGALGVPRGLFTLWQVAGGLLWSLGITAAGYGLGSAIPGVDQYLLPAIAVIVIVSLLPLVLEARRARRAHKARGDQMARGDQTSQERAGQDGSTEPRPASRPSQPPAARPGPRDPGQQGPGRPADGIWEYSEYRESLQHQESPRYQHSPRHLRKGN
jgi:membrane-associated protein